jgi:hypothetical protein
MPFSSNGVQENVLSTAIEVKDQVTRGFTFTVDSSYTPHTAKRGALAKAEWVSENSKVNADLNLNGNPLFSLAAVLAHQNLLFGVQGKYDTATNEVRNTSAAVSYATSEYVTHAFTNDGREFGASWYHKVHKNLELGAQLGWTTGEQSTRFGLASKYRIAPDLILRSKIDNKSNVAVSGRKEEARLITTVGDTHHFSYSRPEPSSEADSIGAVWTRPANQ